MNKVINKKLYYTFILITLLFVFILITIIFFNYKPFEVWLGFIGSILGGLFTMLGVILTLAHNEESKKNDYIKEIIPFIKAHKNETIFIKDTFQPIRIENISKYPLVNFKIDCIGSNFRDQHIPISEKDIIISNSLPSGECFDLVFTDIPVDFNDIRGNDYLEINMNVSFYDFMNEICYSHYIDFSVVRNSEYMTFENTLMIDKVSNRFNYIKKEYDNNLSKELKDLFKQ